MHRLDSLLLLASLLTVSCLLTPTSGLKCYICDSITEPDCLQDPPDDLKADFSVGRQIGQNPRPPVPDAVVCWKQYQDVGGLKVVVRQCGGWASTENGTSTEETCYDRVGSKGIRSTYCKCNRDFCNTASQLVKAPAGAAAVLAALVSGWLIF